jgi:hypothetical protein
VCLNAAGLTGRPGRMVQLLLPKGPGPGLGAVGSEASKRTNSASTPWLLQSERILISNLQASAMRTAVSPCDPGLTHPPAHRFSGPFRSGSVIAPMPVGRDPADHELGREAAEPGTTRPRQTTKGARFMANDELQAMVRDELFWDPRVDSDAAAVSATTARSPHEHGEGQAPRGVSRRRRAARARISGRARRCGLLSPRSPTRGFVSDCHTGALVAPGTCPNMTIIVSDGKTPVAAGAK